MKTKAKALSTVDIEAMIAADSAGTLDLPIFDENYYNQQLPLFARQENKGFKHFIEVGEAMGLLPHPLFDPEYVTMQAKAAGVEIGADFSAFTYMLAQDVSPNRLFSVQFYRAALMAAGVKLAATDLTITYFLAHWFESRLAFSPYFDVNFYMLDNPHLVNSSANPLDHYFRVPQRERSDANPMFHAGYYMQTYQPGAVDPLVDFLNSGCGELNLPNPYAAKELLSDAFLTPENLLRYIETGGE